MASKNRETCLCVYSAQLLNACQRLCIHPTSKVARENLEVFLNLWLTLYSDVQQLSRDISELLLERTSCFAQQHSNYVPQNSPAKHVTIREASPSPGSGLRSDQYTRPAAMASSATTSLPPSDMSRPSSTVPGGGGVVGGRMPLQTHKTASKALDSDEQAAIEQTGLDMKTAASEADEETSKCPDTEDNDIVRRAKAMSLMAFSMYQFTRGEGELKTTQDLFTQAEFFAEEANKFYKVVRVFTYQVNVITSSFQCFFSFLNEEQRKCIATYMHMYKELVHV